MRSRRGIGRSLSLGRRMVLDLLHFSAGVPQIPMERVMRLAPLVEARSRANPRPGWCAVFTKAFALVAERRPELRDVYLHYPWPRIYRYDRNVAAVIVEREEAGERFPLSLRLENPGSMSLLEIDAAIRLAKSAPLNEIASFRRAIRLARSPLPIRRLAMWLAFRWLGNWHHRFIGNYGVTVVAGLGASQLAIVSCMTSNIHYGLFADDGSLPVRMSFDHRVIDGADFARAMVELETVLLTDILDEVRTIGARLAA